MRRFLCIIVAVALLAIACVIPTIASADVPNTSLAAAYATDGEQYLGTGFSISSNGWRGSDAMVQDAAADQSTCAADATNLAPAATDGVGYTASQANALAGQDHGSAAHQQCVTALQDELANVQATPTTFGQTAMARQAANHGRCTPKACKVKVEGRNKAGKHVWKTKWIKRGKRVFLWITKQATEVQGKWHPAGQPFGVGLGGCTNKLAQTFQRVTTVKFKLKYKYYKLGKPSPKGDTDGPIGPGGDPSPAPTPETPPINNEPGPTNPPI